MPRRKFRSILALLVALAGSEAAVAQASCAPQWTDGYFSFAGFTGGVQTMTTTFVEWDPDGAGPSPPVFVAGGAFSFAGGLPANNVAQWDGWSWSALGPGVPPPTALAVFDEDGAGAAPPRLIAGGTFDPLGGGAMPPFISRWDGVTWTPLGAGLSGDGALRMVVVDEDGNGPLPQSLFVGAGSPPGLTSAGGIPMMGGVARWDGTSWTVLPPHPGGPLVTAMSFFEDPQLGVGHPELVVAAGNGTMTTVARWSAGAWVPYGLPIWGSALSLAVYDHDDSGPAPARLFIGGKRASNQVGPLHLAFWNGSAWISVPLPCAPNYCSSFDYVTTLKVFDDDGPAGPHLPKLIIGGHSSSFGIVLGWDGTQFVPPDMTTYQGNEILCIESFRRDPSSAPRLFVGGKLTGVDPNYGFSCQAFVEWSGQTWSVPGHGIGATVRAETMFDEDGPGPAPAQLVAGGNFGVAIPGGATYGVARWDGTSWSPLGQGLNMAVTSLVAIDEDGPGPNPPVLYAGGSTPSMAPGTQVARYSNGSWTQLPTWGNGRECLALAAFDADGSGPDPVKLIAAGRLASHGVLAPNQYFESSWAIVRRLDGSAWTVLGESPPANNLTRAATALAVFDDDGPGPHGPSLFVGGTFPSMGGVASANVARWDGSWHAVAGSPTGVNALSVWDPDDSGPLLPRLYAGAAGLHEFDGAVWSTLGLTGPTGAAVASLCVHDADGAGPGTPRLYVGGAFSAIGGAPALGIASWDAGWTQLGTGVAYPVLPLLSLPTLASVNALCSVDEQWPGYPGRAALYAAGSFLQAGGASSSNIARWAAEPNLSLGFTTSGSGDLLVGNTSCLPYANYLSNFTTDPMNAVSPGAGWWAGLHITFPEILDQYLSGSPPFVGVLDATGASTYFVPAALASSFAGITVYGVTQTYDPVLLVPRAASSVASWQF